MPDRGECNHRSSANPFAASCLRLPCGRSYKFRPPRIGSALQWAYRIHAASAVVQEEWTAAVDAEANSLGLIIHRYDVTAPEPALRNTEISPYRFLFLTSDLDVVVSAANAAGAATGALKPQTGNLSFQVCEHFARKPPVIFFVGAPISLACYGDAATRAT